MRALIFDFFYPLSISHLECLGGEIFVGNMAIAFSETMALDMPLVTGNSALIVKWRCLSVHIPVED